MQSSNANIFVFFMWIVFAIVCHLFTTGVKYGVTVMNRIILTTAVQGLLWTAVAFCYGMGIFAMAFPGQMAKFYDTVGDRTLSALYYGRVYERNKTPENLYNALEKNILANKTGAIIKYGKIWFDGTDRDDVINQVDKYLIERTDANYPAGISVALDNMRAFVMGRACNTDDRLRTGYIRALLSTNKTADFAEARRVFLWATDPVDINLQRPSYAILEFGDKITTELKNAFTTYFVEFEDLFEQQEGSLQTPNHYKPKYFVDNAMELFDAQYPN